MIRAVGKKAVVAVSAALMTCSVSLMAQGPLPAGAPSGGSVTDRLSPQDLEQVSRKRDLEGILTQLRELHARSEYAEMMRLIQEAERAYPNDFKLRNYGYLAQQGLEASKRPSVEPVVSPDSPALQGASFPSLPDVVPADPPPFSSPNPALPALPSLPSVVEETPSSQSSLPSLPSLPAAETGNVDQPPAQDDVAASAVPPNPPMKSAESAAAATDSSAQQFLKNPTFRKALLALAGISALIGAILLLRRRKAAAVAEGAAKRAARSSGMGLRGGEGGAATPPGIPGSAQPSLSIRDALTEVEVNEEEVARGIAESMGTRSTPAAAVTMPAFDSLFPGGPDQPTGYHENLPTMVDTLVEDDEPGVAPAASTPSAGSVFGGSTPAGSSRNPAASDGGVSFDDLGIVLFDEKPPVIQPPPAGAFSAANPGAGDDEKEKDPFAAFNFGGLAAEDKPATTPAPMNPAAPAAPKPAEAGKSAEPSLPGMTVGDEPIRLSDLNLFSPGAQPAEPPVSDAKPQAVRSKAAPDETLSATVDLSEVLFGRFDEAPGTSKKPGTAEDQTVSLSALGSAEDSFQGIPLPPPTPAPSPFSETVVMPAIGQSPSAPQDAPLSLDLLMESGSSSAPTGEDTVVSDFQNQDTIQISGMELSLGDHNNSPEHTSSATVGLRDETLASGSGTNGSQSEAALTLPPAAKSEEQTYYASPQKAEGSFDERSERMFHEQRDRAEKAMAEQNWKQAVHYLSIAAAIRPEDADVMQKLKHAREQKRRLEAGV